MLRPLALGLLLVPLLVVLAPSCSPDQGREELCGDLVDDDADGLTDCADPDCAQRPCAVETACARGGVCAQGVCDREFLKGPVCREAGAGECAAAETCNGVDPDCPPDVGQPAGTVCRASTGLCDAAEVCDGTEGPCPEDALEPAGAVCRAATDVCDAPEVCDGRSAACPPDEVMPAFVECRPAAGPCDVPDFCDGVLSTCANDLRVSSGTVCREASSPCEAPEVCDGADVDCPEEVEAPAPAGTVCRAPESACEAPEVCDGVTLICPVPWTGPASSSTVCRPSAGECDVQETCDGNGLACGEDHFQPQGTACGGALICTGDAAACPSWHQESPLPAYRHWLAVRALTPDDVWIAGETRWPPPGRPSAVAHWDGRAWTEIEDLPCEGDWRAIWSSESGEVWFAGTCGVIRWDGAQWTRPMVAEDAGFRALWGSGPDDVWAVGDNVMAHWDGQAWSGSSVAWMLGTVWGSASDDVWAGGWVPSSGPYGFASTLLHWDGSAWELQDSEPWGSGDPVWALYGTGPSDVWCGNGVSLAHFDGERWTGLPAFDPPRSINAIWADPGGKVYVSTYGGGVVAIDPSSGSSSNLGVVSYQMSWAESISGTSGSDLWVAAEGGPWHYDGANWTDHLEGMTEDLVGVISTPDARWAAGGRTILRATESGTWTRLETLPDSLKAINGLWSPGGDELWVFGRAEDAAGVRPLLAHWDGTHWSGVEPAPEVWAMWGSSPDDVWGVGTGGLARHWDGSGWTDFATGTTGRLRAIAGATPSDVWAAGEAGVMCHFDGTSWSAVDTGRTGDILTLAAAPGELWALESSDSRTNLLSWDGASWSLRSTTSESLTALWRNSTTDLWAVGEAYAARRWNGVDWLEVPVEGGWGTLRGVTGQAQGEVWVAGNVGTILHLRP